MDKNMAPQKPMPPTEAIAFENRSELLKKGDDLAGCGYTVMFDGTGYYSDVNFLPGVTEEMLHWWFAWRGAEAERFAQLAPGEFISSVSMQQDKIVDEDLTDFEKYWDTTQAVVKIGPMGPQTEFVNFKCPEDAGFAESEYKDGDSVSLICARGFAEGEPPVASPDYFVAHKLIKKDDGVAVRSTCWIGWTLRYGKEFKQLPNSFRMPPMFAMGAMLANKKEWMSLAGVLPKLYEENANK